MENSLDGIEAIPEQYSQSSKKVPDINFFYRCLFLDLQYKWANVLS